eukprot:m.240493 g.240493  ORF g.240493 m.240493 type:complete len:214 (-) comp17439_c0_seq8:6682-7323(-)
MGSRTIIESVTKPPGRRQELDVDLIYTLLQNQPFLHDWPPSIKRELGRKVSYAHYEQGDYIFRLGEPLDTIFVILLGNVTCGKSMRQASQWLAEGVKLRLGNRHSEDAIAVSPVAMACISLADYLELQQRVTSQPSSSTGTASLPPLTPHRIGTTPADPNLMQVLHLEFPEETDDTIVPKPDGGSGDEYGFGGDSDEEVCTDMLFVPKHACIY